MFCKNCGNVLSPDSKFCPYCGTKVDTLEDLKKTLQESFINDIPEKSEPEIVNHTIEDPVIEESVIEEPKIQEKVMDSAVAEAKQAQPFQPEQAKMPIQETAKAVSTEEEILEEDMQNIVVNILQEKDESKSVNPACVVGLIFSIVGVLILPLGFVGLIVSIVGLCTRAHKPNQSGKAAGVIGTILGALATAIMLGAVILLIVFGQIAFGDGQIVFGDTTINLPEMIGSGIHLTLKI